MQTHCMHGIHLGHIILPLGDLGAKETGVITITLLQLACHE